MALDVIGNQESTGLTASAKIAVTGGSASGDAPATTVVVPKVSMSITPSPSTVQAGDTVTYTLVVSNTSAGGSGADAYNLDIATSFPAGLSYVSGSLSNTSGTAPTTISDSGGSPVFDFSDLALGQASTLTFRATVQGSTGPYQTLSTVASATYTSIPTSPTTQQSTYNTASTGRTYVQASSVDNLGATASAPVTTKLPALVETITGTSLSTTAGTSVAIGELVHYELTVTVPDGTTSNASISEAFPAGLALVSLDALTASAPLSTSMTGGFAGVLSSATAGGSGGLFSIDLGTITNSNTDTAQTQTLVLDFTGVVLNVGSNVAGTALADGTTYAGNGGSEPASTSVSVVEPHVGVGLARSSATGDAGGPAITFTIVVSATSGTGADAYNAELTDALPSGYTYANNSLTNTAGTAPSASSDANGTITATFADLAPGATSTLQFRAVLSGTTDPGQVVSDSVSMAYASLPVGTTSPESTDNALSTQRDGSTSGPGGAANTYAGTASVSVTVNANSIAGVVFNDANNDGVVDSGEAGLASVPVLLTGRDNLGNAVSLTTTTAADGSYLFGSLRPGTYAVSITPPAGFLDGQAVAGTPFGGSSPSPDFLSGLAIPVGTNAPGAGYDFAELLPASIAGQVFSDANNNGVADTGEAGISGVTIALSGTNDQGASVGLITTTNSTGGFMFNGLRPGNYTATETAPSGYLPGTNSAGTSGGTFAGTALGGIALAQGTSASGITYAELATASIAGNIYLDAQDRGLIQVGDPGIGGVVLTLTGTNDLGLPVVATTTAANDGTYEFAGLPPGTYALGETAPSNDLSGNDAAGSLGGTVGSGAIGSIPIDVGASGSGYDFGELLPASIAGLVYNDANDNGAVETGDSGRPGVTITLSGTSDRAARSV